MSRQYIPQYENATDFGANYITKLWKASTDEVWWSGLSFFTSMRRCLLLKISTSFSNALVFGLNHFQFSSGLIIGCKHFENKSPWSSCTFSICLRIDCHFATMRSPVIADRFCDEAARQYMWLLILLIHSRTRPQSFCYASFSSFFDRPFATCQTS